MRKDSGCFYGSSYLKMNSTDGYRIQMDSNISAAIVIGLMGTQPTMTIRCFTSPQKGYIYFDNIIQLNIKLNQKETQCHN